MSRIGICGERARDIYAVEVDEAASNKLLRDIDEVLIGAVLGTTEDSEAWRLMRDMAKAYRAEIKEALGGKEP